MGYVHHDAGVTPEWLSSGHWEIEVAGVRHAARAQLQPWYDPKGERIKV
jgi:4-methylaminobutanoate oxidase (formaldehyde-forming)